jgi:hypothetical protein
MCSISYGISLDSERSGAQFITIMQAGILLGHADTVTDGIHWKGFLFVVLGIPFELAIFRVTDGERQSTEYKTRSVHNFLVFCKVIVVGWIYKRMSDKLYQTGGAKACWKWHLRKLGGDQTGMEDFSDAIRFLLLFHASSAFAFRSINHFSSEV